MKLKISTIILFIYFLLFNIAKAEEVTTQNITNRENHTFEILQIVIACLNVAVVIYIFYKQNQLTKEERKNNYQIFWYKEIFLKENISLIEEYFLSCEKIICDIENVRNKLISDNLKMEDYIVKVEKINGEKIEEFQKFNSFIPHKITNVASAIDYKLEQQIIEFFINFEDYYTTEIGNWKNDLDNRAQEIILGVNEKKRDFLHIIYSEGKKLVQ